MKFFIVDAFSKKIFGGNQAGVVIIRENDDFPKEEIMVKIAAELRYSETAFIKKIGENEFHTRYFTPTEEVDLCGHATIGTFSVLLKEGVITEGKIYKNNTKAGKLDIEIKDGNIFMDMGKPELIFNLENQDEIEKIYKIMGIGFENQGEIKLNSNKKLFPKAISTGLPDIMLPVKNEEELNAISPNFDELSKISEYYKVVGLHAFTINTDDGSVKCRNFAPLFGIPEEAATGTSNGALTYYLYLNEIISVGETTKFIQGEKMKRPSEIVSKLISNEKIKIGGSAVILGSGELFI